MCSGELSLQARPDSNFYSQVSLINFTFPPFDQDLFFFFPEKLQIRSQDLCM